MYANAGTSNGMAKSLLDSVGESCTAFNATLAIIRGKYPFNKNVYSWTGVLIELLFLLNERRLLYLCMFGLWQATRDH